MDDRDRGQVSTAAAEVYEALFVPALFGQWAEPMVATVAADSGARVLDVGCGTGVLTRALSQRAVAVGVDVNEGMLAVARQRAPQLEFRSGAAEALPFEDDSFDAATCQFALMFFEDRSAALAEMRRVVRPAGRVVLAVWDSLESSPGYAAMARLLERLFGAEVARALHAPFNLGEREVLQQMLGDAGISEARVDTLSGTARFPSLDAWVETDIRGWTLADALDDEQFESLRTAAHTELSSFVGADGTVSFAAPAHIVTLQA